MVDLENFFFQKEICQKLRVLIWLKNWNIEISWLSWIKYLNWHENSKFQNFDKIATHLQVLKKSKIEIKMSPSCVN